MDFLLWQVIGTCYTIYLYNLRMMPVARLNEVVQICISMKIRLLFTAVLRTKRRRKRDD